MFPNDRFAAPVFAVVAMLLLGAPRVCAQETVFVSFEFAGQSVAKRFGTTLAATEQAMADWLVARLEKAYPYWNYRRTSTTGTDFPRLAVSLRESSPDWVVAVALQPSAGQPDSFSREVKWIDNAELDRVGFPPKDQIPTSVQNTVDGKVMVSPLREELFTALHTVPLVRDVRLASQSEPRAVLALDWSRYWRLGLSDFKVLYRTQAGVATVTCTGVGVKLDYPAPPPASGLVVQLHQFQLGGQVQPIDGRLGELSQPLAVFLTRFDSVAETLLSASGEAGVPSVAPPR